MRRTVEEHVEAINCKRLQGKGVWWFYCHDGVNVKGFGKWCQRIEIQPYINDSTPDCHSVKQFKEAVGKVVEYGLRKRAEGEYVAAGMKDSQGHANPADLRTEFTHEMLKRQRITNAQIDEDEQNG
jgi:hypothetical protein